METFFTYFIKVSVLVTLFYLSYHFLLKKETFFGKNRLFLLLGLTTSVLLPLVTITKTVWIEPEPIVYNEPIFIPDFSGEIITNSIVTEEQKTEINWSYIVAGFYVLGILFFLIKFILSSLSLYKILHKTPVKKLNGYKIIDSPKVKTPFSFFSYIAFDSSSFSEEELQNIITHEKVHSNQKHSLDILLSELFLIAFWFNPFVWLYKKAMVQNLEFIADSCAINQSENRINYQKTLLKMTLNPESLALINPFYQPLIKKRIMMLNKIKSKKSQLWKYLVLAPLLVLFVVLFQTKVVAQTKENKNIAVDAKEVSPEETEVSWEEVKKYIRQGTSSEDVKEHLNIVSSKKKPLYIINGEEIPKEKTNGIWNLEGKVTVIEYDKKEAVEKFGEKGKDGVIVIEGKIENITFDLKQTDLITFLKSAKDYKLIEIYNRWGSLIYSLKPNEKLDENKLNTLEDGTYFYTFEKNSGEKVSGYLYKGDSSMSERVNSPELQKRIKEAEQRAKEAEERVNSPEFQKRIKETEQRAKEAEERVNSPEFQQRIKEAEQRAKEAEERVNSPEFQKRIKEAEQRAKEAEERVNSPEFQKRIEEMKKREKEAQEKSNLSAEELLKKSQERQKKVNEREAIIEVRKKELEERRNMKIDEYETFSIISKDSSDSNIESIKAKMQKKGIQMKVSNLKRNKNGEITKIKISLSESSGDKNNKKEAKTESTIEYYDQTIPDIFIGKRNGKLVIQS